MDCRPHRGTGRAISWREAASAYVLFAFEEMYLFIGNKSISVSIFGALASWLNQDQLIQAGGANVI